MGGGLGPGRAWGSTYSREGAPSHRVVRIRTLGGALSAETLAAASGDLRANGFHARNGRKVAENRCGFSLTSLRSQRLCRVMDCTSVTDGDVSR